MFIKVYCLTQTRSMTYYMTYQSSRQTERSTTSKKAIVLTTTKIWSWVQQGLSAKTDWLTDRQLQSNSDSGSERPRYAEGFNRRSLTASDTVTRRAERIRTLPRALWALHRSAAQLSVAGDTSPCAPEPLRHSDAKMATHSQSINLENFWIIVSISSWRCSSNLALTL